MYSEIYLEYLTSGYARVESPDPRIPGTHNLVGKKIVRLKKSVEILVGQNVSHSSIETIEKQMI